MDSLQRKCHHLYCPDNCSEVKRLMPLKLKAQIKDVKRHIREYKKELQNARRDEEWGAVEYLAGRVEFHLNSLAELEKKYKKETE